VVSTVLCVVCGQVILGIVLFPSFLLLEYRTREELELMPQTKEEHIQDQHGSSDSDSDSSSDSSSDHGTLVLVVVVVVMVVVVVVLVVVVVVVAAATAVAAYSSVSTIGHITICNKVTRR